MNGPTQPTPHIIAWDVILPGPPSDHYRPSIQPVGPYPPEPINPPRDIAPARDIRAAFSDRYLKGCWAALREVE
jgi:hypothetical protein